MGGNAEEDRLPWLEPVEDETAEEGVSAGRLIAGLIAALVILGCVVGGVYWLKQRVAGAPAGGTTANDPTLIAAQTGPYKVKPTDTGGMQVKGQGDSAYAASEGADPNAKIDLSKVPEAPIAKGQPAPAAPQPAPAPAPAPAKPVQTAQAPAPVKTVPVPAAKPAPKPVAPAPAQTAEAPAAPIAGGTVQLGALPSQAGAESAWKSLSGRYGYLAALNHSVVKAEVNGKTYYRLRAAAGGQASSICSKLKVAGEACTVVG
jgi:outer membrane biosynthesis protein TonB